MVSTVHFSSLYLSKLSSSNKAGSDHVYLADTKI